MKTASPVVATWWKANGSKLTLHENGVLTGRVKYGREIEIRMRAVGNEARTRWTLAEAQRRADEYGFTRDSEEARP